MRFEQITAVCLPASETWEVLRIQIEDSDLVSTQKVRGFLGDTNGKEPTCQCKRCSFDPWVGKMPCRRAWQPTPVSSLENPMDRGAWQAIVQRVRHD